MDTTIIIPARLESTRLERKLLLMGPDGKTVLQHTWENAIGVKNANGVYIATDSGQIKHAAEEFGAEVLFVDTKQEIRTGTDRVAYAVHLLPKRPDIIVNLQADEVELSTGWIEHLITVHGFHKISTAAIALKDYGEYTAPETVKVAFEMNHWALVFTRGMVPYIDSQERFSEDFAYKHIGIYLFRSDILQRYATLDQSKNEKLENLEQLRLLDNGIPVKVVKIWDNSGRHPRWPISINTEDSYHRWLKLPS